MLIAFRILPGEREEEEQSEREGHNLSSLVPEIENSHVFWDIKWSEEPRGAGKHTPSLTHTTPGRTALTLISLTLW